MLDQDQGDRRIELEQKVCDRGPLAARESGCGLVQQHQFRVGDAGHRHLQLALLAVRERADEDSQLRGKPDLLGDLTRPLAQLDVPPGAHDRTEVSSLDAECSEIEVVLDAEAQKEP